MHLTGEWFDSLAKNLKTKGAVSAPPAEGVSKKSGAEMRQSQRVGVRFPAKIFIVENGRVARSAQIHVRDMSANGLGIIYNQKLQAKEQFVIELPLEEGGSRRILCEVCNCRRLSDELNAIGAKFIAAKAFEHSAANPPAAPAAAPPQSAPPAQAAHVDVNPSAVPETAAVATASNAQESQLSNSILEARAAEIRKKMFDEN